MRTKHLAVTAGFLATCSLAPAAWALDSSKALICATMVTVECERGGNCITGPAEGVNLPTFLDVNTKRKRITGQRADGSELTTPIERQEKLGDLVILQGGQNAVGWTMSIAETTGHMTVTAAGEDVGFIVHGACRER